MDDNYINQYPEILNEILVETRNVGFNMASEPRTGALLRTLASSKPTGAFLELGTGTGLSAAWILDGMDHESTLTTVDNDPKSVEIAQKFLQKDTRVTFIIQDGIEFLKQGVISSYDFIFADAWPGKFSYLEECIALLKVGGIYIIDDLLPQSNWPEGHAPRVPELMQKIEEMQNTQSVRLAWSSGIMIVVKTS